MASIIYFHMQQKLVFMVMFKTTHFFVLTSKGSRANDGWMHDWTQESVSGSRFLDIASLVLHQDKGHDALVQPVNAISNGNDISHRNQLKVAASSESYHFASNPNGQSVVGKFRLKVDILKVSNDENGSVDVLGEKIEALGLVDQNSSCL